MKNDPEFNIRLVKLVEEREGLYNFYSKHYCDRNMQDRLWTEISDILGEDALTLRERWNNLRGNFSRSLKHGLYPSGERNKREYYLSKHMQFLVPYMKTRKSTGNAEAEFYSRYMLQNGPENHPEEIHIAEVSSEVLNTFSPDSFHEASSSNSFHNTPIPDHEVITIKEENVSKKRKQESDPLMDNVVNYFQKRSSNSEEEQDSDSLFLRSLLPQMAELSEQRKLEFKIEVLQLLKTKLYE